MRFALALLVASLLIAPAVADDSSSDVTPLHDGCAEGPEHEECHEKEAPGFGFIAAIGALAVLAFVSRRRA